MRRRAMRRWESKRTFFLVLSGALVVLCLFVPRSTWRVRVVTISVPSNPPTGISHVVVAQPRGYWLGRGRSKWVLWLHGTNDSGQGMFDSYGHNLSAALLRAGYTLVAPDYSDRTCWGSADCDRDIQVAIQSARDRFHLRGVPYVYSMSMGGVVALNAVAHGVLHPRALYGSYPVFSLSSMYQENHGVQSGSIRRVFHIEQNADYAVNTRGFDPSLDNVRNFAAFPIRVACSDGDTTVNCSENGRALVNAVQQAGGAATYLRCYGNHGNSSCIAPADVVAFFSNH